MWTSAGLPHTTGPLLALQALAVPAVHQGSEGPPRCTMGASAGLGGGPSCLDGMWAEPPPLTCQLQPCAVTSEHEVKGWYTVGTQLMLTMSLILSGASSSHLHPQWSYKSGRQIRGSALPGLSTPHPTASPPPAREQSPQQVLEPRLQSEPRCWEDALGEGTATHSSVPAWRSPWTEESGRHSPRGHKESDVTEETEHKRTFRHSQARFLRTGGLSRALHLCKHWSSYQKFPSSSLPHLSSPPPGLALSPSLTPCPTPRPLSPTLTFTGLGMTVSSSLSTPSGLISWDPRSPRDQRGAPWGV